MKLIADIYDLEYPQHGFSHTHNTVRAFVLNEKHEIMMLHIKGEDYFGKRNHYESPGGGVELKESYQDALIRELIEETGYECAILGEIGMIISRYNLLDRITVSRYYVCEIKSKKKLHRTDEEEVLIDQIVFKSIDAWLKALEKVENPVDRLVHQREIIALKALKAQYNKQ